VNHALNQRVLERFRPTGKAAEPFAIRRSLPEPAIDDGVAWPHCGRRLAATGYSGQSREPEADAWAGIEAEADGAEPVGILAGDIDHVAPAAVVEAFDAVPRQCAGKPTPRNCRIQTTTIASSAI
jgi:hypothetical protein